MFGRDRSDRLHPAPSADRLMLGGRLVMYDLRWESVLLDCVADDDLRPFVGGHQLDSGEPFSLAVALPSDGWRTAALVTLDRWAEAGRALAMELIVSAAGPRIGMSDGATSLVFDLLGVMGRKRAA